MGKMGESNRNAGSLRQEQLIQTASQVVRSERSGLRLQKDRDERG